MLTIPVTKMTKKLVASPGGSLVGNDDLALSLAIISFVGVVEADDGGIVHGCSWPY